MADTESKITNIEDLNIDEITEDFLENEAIEQGIARNVDTRQGSLYRDAADGHIIRTAKFFDDLKQVASIISMSSCTGYVLTEKMAEHGLYRNPPEPTPARYYVIFDGAKPDVGDAVTCDGHVFTVVSVGDKVVIESEETGIEMNNLASGTAVLPEVDINGLVSCTLGELAEPALDAEDDDTARARLIQKCSGPAENGNAAQVQAWCESVEGIGRARIIPLWNGKQTVKAIVINTDGRRPTDAVIEIVQNYIDPGITGMGEGAAAIGQFVTVEGATEVPVNVSVSITKTSTATTTEVQDDLKKYLTEYFKSIALQQNYKEDIQVRYQRVAATITEMPSIIDHEKLLLNGSNSNIAFEINQIPVLGEVTVSDSV